MFKNEKFRPTLMKSLTLYQLSYLTTQMKRI